MSYQHLAKYWDKGSFFKKHIPQNVINILKILQDNHFSAYIVGGAIRDIILGQKPKDFDLVTSATPTEIKKIFKRSARIIGRRFQIVHLYDPQGNIYEVSTFRRSPTIEERQGKYPSHDLQIWNDNFFGTLEDDVWRRDFSVNALYYDPSQENYIIDLTNGLEDIKQRQLHILGDAKERLEEDPVRILRALKLIAQFDFIPDESLFTSLKQYASKINLASSARLSEELRKIILRPFTFKTFKVFIAYDFMEYFWPSFAKFNQKNKTDFLKFLIKERDRLLLSDNYSLSKSLAFASLALPYILSQSKFKNFITDPCKDFEVVLPMLIQHIINFYGELLPPKFLVLRAADIISLLPYFYHCQDKEYIIQHKEYKYARELFILIHQYQQWSKEMLSFWQEPCNIIKKSPNKKSKHRKRSRNKIS